jgi:hypothetical protein
MDDAALLELPDDPTALRRIVLAERADHAAALKEREQTIAQRDSLIAQRDESIQLLSQDNQLLRHRLSALLRSSYGPRAERFDPRQLLLFGLLVPPIDSPGVSSKPKRNGANRSKHGRQKLPDHLPRIPIEHDLSEAEKNCPCCGQERQRIGQEKSEQLEHIPANFVVLQHIRQSAVLHTDDTTVPVMHDGHCRQGRLWTYVGDEQNPYIVYDYTPRAIRPGAAGVVGIVEGLFAGGCLCGIRQALWRRA